MVLNRQVILNLSTCAKTERQLIIISTIEDHDKEYYLDASAWLNPIRCYGPYSYWPVHRFVQVTTWIKKKTQLMKQFQKTILTIFEYAILKDFQKIF